MYVLYQVVVGCIQYINFAYEHFSHDKRDRTCQFKSYVEY